MKWHTQTVGGLTFARGTTKSGVKVILRHVPAKGKRPQRVGVFARVKTGLYEKIASLLTDMAEAQALVAGADED